MKRINRLWSVLALVVAFALSMSFVSCGGGDDAPANNSGQGGNGGSGGTGGNGGTGSTTMSQQEQKEFLDGTAREFLAMVPASDFQNISDLKKEVDRQNGRNVQNWKDEIFNRTFEVLGESRNTETTTNHYSWGTYTTIYNYINRDIRSAYEIANYKGHFELRNGVWMLVEPNTNDLQFTFTASNGSVWVARAETSGAVKRVHAYDTEKRKWVYNNYEYDPVTGNSTSIYDVYYDKESHTIAIPENILVTLTQNGAQVVKTSFKTDITGIVNEEFDISTGDLDVTSVVEINDYKINISQLTYKHNAKAVISAIVSKGSTNLLTIAISSDVSGLPSCNVSAFINNHNFDRHLFDSSNAKNGVVKLDILGKVQIQGTISDVRGVVDKFNAAKDNETNEAQFKANLEDINRYSDLGLYYNNHDVKQADVYMEAFKKTKWNGTAYWTADLVVKFGDESSYSICTNFFSKDNFRDVADILKSLGESYKRLFR